MHNLQRTEIERNKNSRHTKSLNMTFDNIHSAVDLCISIIPLSREE